MRMRSLFAAAVLASTLAAPDGIVAREDVPDPGPRTVRVDVIATDKSGAAIATLTASDFELREDGAPQSLDEARFIRMDGSLPAERADPIRSDADEKAEAARA